MPAAHVAQTRYSVFGLAVVVWSIGSLTSRTLQSEIISKNVRRTLASVETRSAGEDDNVKPTLAVYVRRHGFQGSQSSVNVSKYCHAHLATPFQPAGDQAGYPTAETSGGPCPSLATRSRRTGRATSISSNSLSSSAPSSTSFSKSSAAPRRNTSWCCRNRVHARW